MADETTFLPYLQTDLIGRALAPKRGGRRRRIGVKIQPSANGTSESEDAVSKTTEILGAGDIRGIVPSMIAAQEPRPGTRGFEPNYFPYVDFVDADFPWRFSLDVGGGGDHGRIKPWLVLIVLRADEFEFLTVGADVLPQIRVLQCATSLPNLEQSWASAHVQVDLTGASATLESVLKNKPETSFSRLLCQRDLEDLTTYHAFLVPVFEAGRLRGMGDTEAAEPWDALAWDAASTESRRLPYFKKWRFTTSRNEDFESLVRRLKPNQLGPDSGGGSRTVGVGRPGYYARYNRPGQTVEAEGAIKPVTFERGAKVIEETPLTRRMTATFEQQILSDRAEQAGRDGPKREDPLVSLPIYGKHHAAPVSIAPDAPDSPWVHEVNLDLRLRMMAGAGAAVVRQQQEPFMQKCWEQVGEILEANRLLSRLQTVERLTDILVKKHLEPLPNAVVTVLAEPFFDIVSVDGKLSVSEHLTKTGAPAGTVTRASRRMAVKRPTVVTAKTAGREHRRTVSVGMPASVVTGATKAAPSGAAAKRAQTRTLKRKNAQARRAFARVQTASVKPLALAADVVAPTGDKPTRPKIQAERVKVDKIAGQVIRKVELMPTLKAFARIDTGTKADVKTLEPIMKAPRLPMPLADYLMKQDKNFILPNAAELPDDSVSVGEENRDMIEGFMAGANHEMNRELRWREFPTDLKGTVLARFWDRGAPEDREADDDILPLTDWKKSLGGHFRGRKQAGLVLIIRGELIRRYPDVMVGLVNMTPAELADFTLDSDALKEPVFRGRLDRTTAYYGFAETYKQVEKDLGNYYFALFEPMGRFRFGLDVSSRARRQGADPVPPKRRRPRAESLDDLSWNHMTLLDSGYFDFDVTVRIKGRDDHWGAGRNAASLARATMQKPVCALVKAGSMLGRG